MSSDHSTAEISHFLNKWFSSVKLFTHDIKVKKVEIDVSCAMMHSTCSSPPYTIQQCCGLNISYNPQVVELLPTYYIPLLPLWSGKILRSEQWTVLHMLRIGSGLLSIPYLFRNRDTGCRFHQNNV